MADTKFLFNVIINGQSYNYKDAEARTTIAAILSFNSALANSLATVATSGSYNDLTDKPELADIALSGAYSDLTGAPVLATVATSGDYTDLSNTPNMSDYVTNSKLNDILGVNSELIQNLTSFSAILDDNDQATGILNEIAKKADASSLATVATSGSYNDLINKPELADIALSGAYSDLTGAPALATVATSGDYTDLSNTPDLAAVALSGAYSDLTGTPVLATVATSGSYDDLTDLPQEVSTTLSAVTLTGEVMIINTQNINYSKGVSKIMAKYIV